MRYVIQLASEQVILDQAQMDVLTSTLMGAQRFHNEYIGTGKGDDGTNYSKQVRPYVADEHLQIKVMSDETFDAYVLKTKLSKQQ
jgi:hypothetical protein